MSIAGLIIGLIIVVLFTLWVIAPFLRQKPTIVIADDTVVERQKERLRVYYERVLRNLHDLDEDHATGKLREDEYHVEREQWGRRGIQALKAMEELDTQHLIIQASADEAAIDEAIDRVIDERINANTDQPAPDGVARAQ